MRKILPYLYFAFLLLNFNTVFAQSADIYQKAADGYLDDKNYQAAFDSYTKAIKKGKHDKIDLSFLYTKRGESLKGLGKLDDAIADYNYAIELAPDYSDACWGRGIVYYNLGKYQLAINDYEKTIDLIKAGKGYGNISILYCNIAYCQNWLQNYPEALLADSLSLSIDGQYGRAYSIRGLIHNAMKSYELAVSDYNLALNNVRYNDSTQASELLVGRADNEGYLKKYKVAINDYH